MNFLSKSLLCALSVSALQGTAFGAWASGGGEILGNALNPWFLQNTTMVQSCIELDEAAFGVGIDDATRITKMALDYWKQEFATSTPSLENPEIRVATQDFVFAPCTEATELRIQLGVLSEAQIRAFALLGKRPQQFVGIAVRTEYDEMTLKGKGFIYISPESGPFRFDGVDEAPFPWSLRRNPEWARKFGIFHKVLTHELGHVFGVGHRPSPNREFGGWYSIMDERFPEDVVRHAPEFAWDADWIPGFFSSDRAYHSMEINKPGPALTRLLGAEPHTELVYFRNTAHGTEVVVESQRPESDKVVGLITPSSTALSARFDPVVMVSTATEKKFGPGFSIIDESGLFKNALTGEELPVHYVYSPANRVFSLSGVLDGRLITQFD